MEPAGIALGAISLVGLYNACLDAVDRINSYRQVAEEKRDLFARIVANKDVFQKWAKRVGISAEGLLDPHDARLDDPSTARAIAQVLDCIRGLFDDLCDPSEVVKFDDNEHHLKTFESLRAYKPNPLGTPRSPTRKRDKLAWAFGGKSKLESQVRKFSETIDVLERLVPPHDKSSPHQAPHSEGSLALSYVFCATRLTRL